MNTDFVYIPYILGGCLCFMAIVVIYGFVGMWKDYKNRKAFIETIRKERKRTIYLKGE